MDFWQAIMAALRLMQIIARLKAQGVMGEIRTQLVMEFPDGTQETFPFVRVRL